MEKTRILHVAGSYAALALVVTVGLATVSLLARVATEQEKADQAAGTMRQLSELSTAIHGLLPSVLASYDGKPGQAEVGRFDEACNRCTEARRAIESVAFFEIDITPHLQLVDDRFAEVRNARPVLLDSRHSPESMLAEA